ncbi:hypothetical protein TSAR_002189 [Trichomalopsis sarcophagae]|uniref:Uncharacterized protein n=1 Tax=Trichomalopsis sarcophagae TaxID=543379 RepID=A0A232EV39_9HYME|nr:hypothetical protein TSAR_002189 [Trichomalopsis sarcophagae]
MKNRAILFMMCCILSLTEQQIVQYPTELTAWLLNNTAISNNISNSTYSAIYSSPWCKPDEVMVDGECRPAE